MPKPYIPNDAWSRKAASEGFRARSVYKLQELDEKFRILRNGMTVLDLGAAPGSWLQYALQQVGPKGTCIGIDLQKIEPIDGIRHLYTADITNADAVRKILAEAGTPQVDAILSDLAPHTSGIKDVDQWKSIELSEAVLAIAEECLKPNGWCVIKVLRGADFDDFYGRLRKEWAYVKLQHAKASRDRSREVYVVMKKQR